MTVGRSNILLATLVTAAFSTLPCQPAQLTAQSVLERTPNLPGAWVGGPGTLHFNFLHRFDASGPPTRRVTNSPTFLAAYSAGGYGLVGVHAPAGRE